MTNAERLNVLTWSIILIAAILYSFKFPGWWIFLAIGLMVVIIIWAIIRTYEQVAMRGQVAFRAQQAQAQQELPSVESATSRPVLCRRRRSVLTPLGPPIDPRCGEIVNTQALNLKSSRM